MTFAMSDLDAFRSIDDYPPYQGDVQARLSAIEAERPGQPLTDEARSEWATLTEIDKEIEARKAELRKRADYVARMAQRPENVEAAGSGLPTRRDPGFNIQVGNGRRVPENIYDYAAYRKLSTNDTELRQAYRDGGMKSVEQVRTLAHPAADLERSKDRIDWILEHHDTQDKQFAQRLLTSGSPVYMRAWNKILQHGPDNAWMYLDDEEKRAAALAVGVDSTGGFAVLPYVFDPTIIAIGSHTGAVNPYRTNCRVVPIVGTDTWNPVTATAVTATRTTEAAATTEQGPTFAQAANGAYIVKRIQAFITYSVEMSQDRPDLPTEMAQLIQEAKDNEEEASFAVGPGTTTTCLGVIPPFGTSNSYTGMATAGSVTLAAADTYAVEAALPVRWRFGARWVMNRGNLRKLQALETTGGILFQGSQYFASAGNIDISPVGNTGMKLLGYPVDESPTAPTAGTSHISIATLFAPQTYIIVERVGMTVEVIPHVFGASQGNLPTWQRGLAAVWRNHAAPLIADAGRTLYYLT